MFDSDGSKPLSPEVPYLRFLAGGISNLKDAEPPPLDTLKFPLSFRCGCLFGFRTGGDDLERSSLLSVLVRERVDSIRVTMRTFSACSRRDPDS